MYPLTALPYPSRQRLRELAQPRELYDLQLADIDSTVKELNPLQTVITYDLLHYEFRYLNEKAHIRVEYEPMEIDETLLYKPETATFSSIKPSFFNEPILKHFFLEPAKIILHTCEIDACFLSSLQKLATNTPKIGFYNCNINADVTLASLIAAFPITTHFLFNDCNFKKNFLVDLKNVLALSQTFRTVDICLALTSKFLPCLSKKIISDIMEFMKQYDGKNPFFLNLYRLFIPGFQKEDKKIFAPWLKQVYGPAISFRSHVVRMSSVKKFKVQPMFRRLLWHF